MANYRVRFKKTNGNVSETNVSANSEDEARNKMLMKPEVAEVIAVVKA